MIDFLYVKHRQYLAPNGGGHKVRLARQLTFLFAVIATVLALFIGRLGTIIEASVKIGGLFGGPLLGIFCLGVLSAAPTPRDACRSCWHRLCCACSGPDSLTHISFMWYALLGSVVTYVTGEISAVSFTRPPDYQQRFSRPGQKALGLSHRKRDFGTRNKESAASKAADSAISENGR